MFSESLDHHPTGKIGASRYGSGHAIVIRSSGKLNYLALVTGPVFILRSIIKYVQTPLGLLFNQIRLLVVVVVVVVVYIYGMYI